MNTNQPDLPLYFDPNNSQISEFVGSIRKEVERNEALAAVHMDTTSHNQAVRNKADAAILEAEKFKATLAAPPRNHPLLFEG